MTIKKKQFLFCRDNVNDKIIIEIKSETARVITFTYVVNRLVK